MCATCAAVWVDLPRGGFRVSEGSHPILKATSVVLLCRRTARGPTAAASGGGGRGRGGAGGAGGPPRAQAKEATWTAHTLSLAHPCQRSVFDDKTCHADAEMFSVNQLQCRMSAVPWLPSAIHELVKMCACSAASRSQSSMSSASCWRRRLPTPSTHCKMRRRRSRGCCQRSSAFCDMCRSAATREQRQAAS